MEMTQDAAGMAGAGSAGILSGVRILDFSHQFSGPVATMILGDAGAEVIKVESPGRGDGIRHDAGSSPEIGSRFFWGANRNKRSITLNLKSEQGLAIAQELAAGADVVVENFRPGVMEKLGLGYDALSADNPGLIYLSVSAFGQTGPMADMPGMDLILQAVSGVMAITGESDDRSPVKLGPSVMDMTTALYGTIDILLALMNREKTGAGQKIGLSMLDCGVSLISPLMTALLAGGGNESRCGTGHPNLTPYQAYRDSEGAYFIVACLTNNFWKRLCARLGVEELIADERFVNMRSRNANRAELNAILEPILKTRKADEWIAILSQDDIPCARINKPSEVLRLEQVRHNGLIREAVHPTEGPYQFIASPVGTQPAPQYNRHAPMLGEHTNEILGELGRNADDIARLVADGAI